MGSLILENLENVCRTCLSKDMRMTSIFSSADQIENKTLCELLSACTSIVVHQSDGLPEKICVTCTEELRKSYLFKQLCENSDITLHFYLKEKRESGGPELKNENQRGCNNDNDFDEFFAEEYTTEENVQCSSDDEHISVEYKDTSVEYKDTSVEYKEHLINSNNFEKGSEAEKNSWKYQCDICGKRYKSLKVLTKHQHRHNENFSEDKNTSKVIRNKTGILKKRNQPRTCDVCHKTFKFHSNLERHRLVHTGEKPYLCNVCGKGFAQLSYLKIHSFIHTGEKPYKCHTCERSFSAPGTLMTHIRTHTGERPHICKICGKNFSQSGYLSAHIRTHTGEKPIECKVCQRRFNQSGRLIVHMRMHSGEKPYKCTECGRGFAIKGTLKKHIRTHTGERPYTCSVCKQSFAQSGTLMTHMKTHRPKQDLGSVPLT